ncbi:MAG: PASTA domain-containing protein [Butyrivibrio sp.]|nr:PASTA domain-containing protein [Butyrivibrio sp.]
MNWVNGGNNMTSRMFVNKTAVVFLLMVSVLVLGGWGLFSKKLPDATGKDVNAVKAEIEQLKKEIVIQYDFEFNENVGKGLVSRLDPASGTKVTKGMTVTIFVSRGKPITLSDYTNTNIEAVKGMLASQGLNFDCSTNYSEEIKADNIISMDPEVGTIVEEGTMVNLVVSLGSEYRSVPDYSEMSGDDFAKELEELSAKYNETSEFSSEVATGGIISCNYEPGDKFSIVKDTVKFVTSRGEGVAVPELEGISLEKAQSALDKLGLTYSVTEEYSENKKGTVVTASKKAGDLVKEGEEIALTVSKGTVEQEFKDQCETPSYDDLIRNPSKYESIKIKVRVNITKVENDTLLGIKYGETVWGTYQGSKIVITDDRDNKEPGFRAGDTITIYGYGNGTATVNVKQKEYQGGVLIGFSYNKTVDSYDIPDIKVKYVDF